MSTTKTIFRVAVTLLSIISLFLLPSAAYAEMSTEAKGLIAFTIVVLAIVYIAVFVFRLTDSMSEAVDKMATHKRWLFFIFLGLAATGTAVVCREAIEASVDKVICAISTGDACKDRERRKKIAKVDEVLANCFHRHKSDAVTLQACYASVAGTQPVAPVLQAHTPAQQAAQPKQLCRDEFYGRQVSGCVNVPPNTWTDVKIGYTNGYFDWEGGLTPSSVRIRVNGDTMTWAEVAEKKPLLSGKLISVYVTSNEAAILYWMK